MVDANFKREYTAIDIAKLICAFLVVAIHTEPFANHYWFDKAFGVLTRIPVPYFFTSSGFFLYLNGGDNLPFTKLVKYCLRILRLYCIWSIFYLPLLYSKCALPEGFNHGMFFKSIFWLGTGSHLWYLIASIVAAIMTWCCIRATSVRTTLLISIAFLFFGTVFSNYAPLVRMFFVDPSGVVGKIFSILDMLGTRNGIFYGFFYVCLGAMIAKGYRKFKMTTYIVVFLISFVMLAIEGVIAVRVVGSSDRNLWFAAPFVVWATFMITLKLAPDISKKTALACRNGSTLIYTSHRLFIVLLIEMFAMKKGVMLFGATTAIVTAFSAVFLLLQKKFHVLKFLM